MSKLNIPTDLSRGAHKGSWDEAMALEKWEPLETGLDQIYRRNRSMLSFQLMFTNAFHLVKHGYGKLVYSRLEESMKKRILEQQEAIVGATEATLLKILSEQWDTHSVTTARTAELLMHLDRQYCVAGPVKSINALGLHIFGELILKNASISERVRAVFLKTVDNERIGDEVPSHTLKAVSSMMIAVDRREIFEKQIETPYLQATVEFYRAESERLISSLTTPRFIESFFDRLTEERNRVKRCLDDSTLPKVERILKEHFFSPHEQTLLSKAGCGIEDMMKAWQVIDLKRLFEAFVFVGDTTPMTKQVAQYITREGCAMVTNKEVCSSPITFVEKVIELKTKIDTLLKEAFSSSGRDRLVEIELSRAFEEVANKNNQCAEFLSMYLDAKLKSPPEAEELDTCCDNVLSVYKVLRDKDLFDIAYKIHLSRRLLAAKNAASEEQERVFIDKLKREFGASATSKLEGMFGDKRISEELMEGFRSRLESRGERLPVELSVAVLTSGFWPQTPSLSITMPGELERCAAVFRSFYTSRFKGRRLDYQYSLGAVDVRMVHSRKYEINLPLLSLPVLLLFQGDDQYTMNDIAAKIGGVPVAEAVKLCAALTRAASTHTGILKIEGQAAGANTLTATSKISFNTDFKSKHLKVRVTAVSIVKEREGQGNTSETRAKVDEDRKYKLDAAIVRIMKSRRTLEHRVLVHEVTNVLKNSFCPQPDEIKRRIEHLIEREFLERSANSRSQYNYLA